MSDINIKVNVVSKAAEASVSGLAREAKSAENSFKRLNVNIKSGSQFLASFGGNLAAIGVGKAIGALSNAFSALTNTVFDSTLSLETAATQFEVLTGSAGAANAVIRDLQEFTARTPFQFQDVAKASQTLLAFGFSINEVKNNLQVLGDVSAATGQPLKDISLIFGQVSAAGKLTGERLLQLEERGIILGPALAKSMGVAESSVRDLVSQGKVDFKTFENAFKTLNKEGEIAFNGIEKRSLTLQGRISTLKDNIELFAAGIGSRLNPALKAGTTALTNFIQNLGQSAAFNQFLDTLANKIPDAVRFFSEAFVVGIKIFNAFRTGINVVSGGLFSLTTGALAAAEAALELGSAIGRFTGFDTTGIDNARDAINRLKNVSAEAANQAALDNERIQTSEEQLVASIRTGTDILVKSYEEEKLAAEAAANATEASIAKKVEVQQQFRNISQLFAEQAREREVAAREEELARQEAESNADFQFLEQNLGKQEAAKIAAEAKRLENAGKHEQALKVLGDAREKAEDERLKAQKKRDDDLIKDRSSTLSTIATLQNSNNKTLATIGKAAALTQIAIDGPQAVTKALAAFPPPFNFAAATAVGAAVAAQAAKVAGLAFEDGGIVPGNSFSGDRVFARVNSGEMVLNRQQQSTLFNMANGGGGSGRAIEVTSVVQIGEEEIARAVSRQVAQGFELGEGGV